MTSTDQFFAEMRAARGEDRPTADDLPGELDAPRPPLTVKVNGWTYPAVECRAGCGTPVLPASGLCDHCQDLYYAQR